MPQAAERLDKVGGKPVPVQTKVCKITLSAPEGHRWVTLILPQGFVSVSRSLPRVSVGHTPVQSEPQSLSSSRELSPCQSGLDKQFEN